MATKQTPSFLAEAAIGAAKKAGAILKKGFGTQFVITQKGSQHDLVTEYDAMAEKTIISHLSSICPSSAFLAEESGLTPHPEATVTWVIDPLDGTMNFAHHIPLFCISIAAMVDEQIVAGVIFNPLHDELFVAVRGEGAKLNGNPISVSRTASIGEALFATGFPYHSSAERLKCEEQFLKILELANPIRIIGSAALTLAYVAAGRVDIYWGVNLKAWDMAAGILLIEEAGGTITDHDGSRLMMQTASHALASNGALHPPACHLLFG
jgi:myo-inositol-1(or 4)-monophosphatase